jgi:NAD(P)-dependent dehydrogenase (short-subunit alcohol dehydrogenase family)
MREIRGKVAVVTGGGSGIGRATALALGQRGANLAVCDRDGASAEETANAVAELGCRASPHEVDVSSEDEMRGLVKAVIGEHGAVDIVVNNAGIAAAPTPVTDLDLDQFRRIIDVNFWGVVYGSLFFLPELMTRPTANLVNVSSNAGLIGYLLLAPYSSSKFAVRGFTDALRMELRRSPVHVTAVYPGSTKTQLMAHSPLIDEGRRAAVQNSFDRAWGRPPEAVAKEIVTAVKKNRSRVVAGADSAVLDGLVRLLPGASSRLLGGSVEKFLQKTLAGTTDAETRQNARSER